MAAPRLSLWTETKAVERERHLPGSMDVALLRPWIEARTAGAHPHRGSMAPLHP